MRAEGSEAGGVRWGWTVEPASPKLLHLMRPFSKKKCILDLGTVDPEARESEEFIPQLLSSPPMLA